MTSAINYVCIVILVIVIDVNGAAFSKISNGNVERNLASEDFAEGPLKALLNVAETDRFRLINEKVEELGDDIESSVYVINSELGAKVLVVANNKLSLNAEGIGNLILAHVQVYLKQEFKDNAFMQLMVMNFVEGWIKQAIAAVGGDINNTTVPLDGEDTTVRTGTISKRDLAFEQRLVRRRVTRDTGPLRRLTGYLNTLIKRVILNVLSGWYERIGKMLTYSLRNLLNGVLDRVLPCTECTSLV